MFLSESDQELMCSLVRLSSLPKKLYVGEGITQELRNSKFRCCVRLTRGNVEDLDVGTFEVFLFSHNSKSIVHYIKIQHYLNVSKEVGDPWYIESIPYVKGECLPANECFKRYCKQRSRLEFVQILDVIQTDAQYNALDELLVQIEEKLNSTIVTEV